MTTSWWPKSVKRALDGMAYKAETGPQLAQIGQQEAESNMQSAGWQPMTQADIPQPTAPTPLPAIELPSLEEMTAKWRPVAQSAPTPSGTPSAMPTAPGLTPATITSGPRPGQTLQPGESVGNVSFGPPSGPPSDGVLRWSSDVDEASRTYGVPREIIMGIMDIESGGNPGAVSAAGAQGLMQVMPFHYSAGEDGMDPRTSIHRGTKILADNYRRYGDWDRAAAAYFGAIDENGNITDATDATGTNGSKYVALFRGATSKYGTGAQTYPDRGQPVVRQDVPTAPLTPPQASDARTYPEQSVRPMPAPATGPKLRVRDKWGNEFEMTQDDLNKRPGGSADLTILGPVAMNAGAGLPPAAPATPAGPGSSPPAAGAGALHPTVAQKWRQQFGRDPSPEEAAELAGLLGVSA